MKAAAILLLLFGLALCLAPPAKAQGRNYPEPLPYLSPNQVQALMEKHPEFRNLNRRRSDNTVIISFQQYGEHAFSVPLEGFFERYGDFLGLGPHDEMRLSKAGKYNRSRWASSELLVCDSVYTYRQYHKGYPFRRELRSAVFWTSKGKVVKAGFHILPGLDMDTTFHVSEEKAIQIALDTVKAEQYVWDTDWGKGARPKIRKLIETKKDGSYAITYYITVQTWKPEWDEWALCIDANNGEVLLKYHQYLKDCPTSNTFPSNSNLHGAPPCMRACYSSSSGGSPINQYECEVTEVYGSTTGSPDCAAPVSTSVTVPTLFYGCQTITTDYCPVDELYYLHNTASSLWPPIHVKIFEGPGTYFGGTAALPPFTVGFEGGDDYWFMDNESHKQDLTGVSAYWAASVAYDCFKNLYGINGYDNMGGTTEIQVYAPPTAALWLQDDNVLLIGRTYDSYHNPHVALDVIAHEYGHGIMRNAFGILVPDNIGEKRALHEGLADVFGIIVERYAVNNGIILDSEFDWYFDEDSQRKPNRSAEFPKESYANAGGNPEYCQVDTYGGLGWNSAPIDTEVGAYVKAGVISHWFYLLAGQLSGSGLVLSGQNDLGNDYEVVSIGVKSAADIVMNALELYQMEHYAGEADFNKFKAATMKSVKQIHGNCVLTPFEINYTRSVAHAWYAVGMGETDLDDVLDVGCRCTITAGAEELIYIAEVKVENLANPSGNEEPDGYINYVGDIGAVNLERGQLFLPQLASVPAANKDIPIYWKIWIDHNRDGTFDSYEKVYAFKQIPGAAISDIFLPDDMPLGKTVMRVAMRVGQPISDDGCESFTGGGVEDYEVNILESSGMGYIQYKREGEAGVSLYPNPVQDRLHVRCANLPRGQSLLQLYNLNGSLVEGMVVDGGNADASLDVSGLPAGTYILHLQNGGFAFTQKVLVLH